MELSTLREQSEDLLARLARAQLEQATRGQRIDHAGLFSMHPALSATEAFDLAREALAEASDAPARASARRLMELVAFCAEGRLTAHARLARAEFEARTEIGFERERIPLLELPSRIANEPEHDRRLLLARLRDATYVQLDGPLSRQIEDCVALAGRLGFPSYEALLTEVSGIDLAALGAEAESLLRSSEDAWRDLLSFGARHTGVRMTLRPHGEAVAADLERFSRLERLDDLFRARRLAPLSVELFATLGLSADQEGRIGLDLEARQGGDPRPVVAPIFVPGRIAVVVRPGGGVGDFLALFEALGRAQHLACADGGAPVEDRRFGDESVGRGYGALFERLLTDDGFLRRYLGADRHEALEAARLVAIELLRRLRADCARLLFQRTLFLEGPVHELRGLYRETMGGAMLVEWPVEPWLHDVEPRMQPARRLRAAALEPILRDWLRTQANEDWWRNPRTGRLLQPLFSRGYRDDASAIAQGLGAELTLARAAERLIEVATR